AVEAGAEVVVGELLEVLHAEATRARARTKTSGFDNRDIIGGVPSIPIFKVAYREVRHASDPSDVTDATETS
ncbi:hypothetical protein MNBD_ACTINO02-657, partial [hydrothermal vent metagenome]